MLKIYLTNLALYNSGTLLGEWVELPITDEKLAEVFDRIKISHDDISYTDCFGCPYEEYFITDYETDIDGLHIGEYDNLDDLNELAETLEDLDEYEREIVEAMISEGYELEEALEKKDDCIIYNDCNDMTDVAMEYVEETTRPS